MATKTVYRNSSSVFYTIYVTCSVDNSYSDTQAKVTWNSYVKFGDWYLWGIRLKTYVNGSQVNSVAAACTSSYQTVCSGSGTVYINKTTSAQTISFSATTSSETVSGYGGIGSGYTGTASGTFTVNAGVFEYAPNTPSSCTLTETTTDTTGTVTYAYAAATNKPITKSQVATQKDNEEWIYTTYSNSTTKSHTFDLTSNSRYYAAVRVGNNTGWSGWKYSDYIYTTPAAPSSGYGMYVDGTINLTAQVSNIKYPSSYEWQRSTNSSFSNPTTLVLTAASGTDTYTTDGDLYYRVRCVGIDGGKSDWCSFKAGRKIQMFFWVPDGAVAQGIYINSD